MKKIICSLSLIVLMQNVFAGFHYSVSYVNHTQNTSGQSSNTAINVMANIGDSVSLMTLCNGLQYAPGEWWFTLCSTCPWDTVPNGSLTNPLNIVITQYGMYHTLTETGNIFTIIPPAPPAMPVITGKKHGVCNRKNVIYKVPYVQGISYYTWTVPPAATIVSGQGTWLLIVNFPNTTISGQITATATNPFGTSPAGVITVNSLPALPSLISGFPSVCSGSSGHVFQIAPVFSAVSYQWVGPAGSHISDGITTSTNNILTTTSTSVTVSFGTVTPTSVLKVKANNNCGSSNFRKLTLIPCSPRNESEEAEMESLHTINSVNIFPTPVNSSLTIELHSAVPNDIEISFYDITGKQFKTGLYKNISGEFIKNENTEALAKGIYFVRIKAGGQSVQKKFIKM
ncbi:MAG TPA: T9SS type A sorting domain-containing protein [Bacteroidia bacterium]|nr:T9SS type A sorting domain-containing protein [Bacteroidia bacterium]